jgi:hypothetical protein
MRKSRAYEVEVREKKHQAVIYIGLGKKATFQWPDKRTTNQTGTCGSSKQRQFSMVCGQTRDSRTCSPAWGYARRQQRPGIIFCIGPIGLIRCIHGRGASSAQPGKKLSENSIPYNIVLA